MSEVGKYLKLEKIDNGDFGITNNKDEYLGCILKQRVGRFMQWAYCPASDISITAGCMDEIRKMLRNPDKYLEKG